MGMHAARSHLEPAPLAGDLQLVLQHLAGLQQVATWGARLIWLAGANARRQLLWSRGIAALSGAVANEMTAASSADGERHQGLALQEL